MQYVNVVFAAFFLLFYCPLVARKSMNAAASCINWIVVSLIQQYLLHLMFANISRHELLVVPDQLKLRQKHLIKLNKSAFYFSLIQLLICERIHLFFHSFKTSSNCTHNQLYVNPVISGLASNISSPAADAPNHIGLAYFQSAQHIPTSNCVILSLFLSLLCRQWISQRHQHSAPLSLIPVHPLTYKAHPTLTLTHSALWWGK